MTMDCQLARQTLDASRPSRRDWQEPELRLAAAHVADCEECAAFLAQRDDWDIAIADSLEAVELPPGLEARLLTALGCELQPSRPVEFQAPSRAGRRRWWLPATLTGLLIVVCLWKLQTAPPPFLTVEDVFAAINVRIDPQAAADARLASNRFDAGFAAPLPDAEWQSVVARSEPWGVEIDSRPGHDAAVYAFEQGRIRGLLVVVPRSLVSDAPVSSLPLRGNYRYVPRPHVAWTAGENVYICVLEQGSLEDWQRQFYGSAA